MAILGEAFADARLQCSPKLRDGPKKKPKLWSAFPRVGVYFPVLLGCALKSLLNE